MPLDPEPLRGQLALVTGAARGIGRATAGRLAAAGADVALLGRRNLDETVALVESHGRRATVVLADLADRAQTATALSRFLGLVDHLDVLVSNAGVMDIGSVTDIDDDQWDRVIDVNLGGAFRVIRHCWSALAAAGGRCVIVGSTGAYHGGVLASPAYVASKGGLHALVRSLATKGAAEGIRVNGVIPGPIDTDMIPPPEQGGDRVPSTLLGRKGRPEEVGDAIVFLAGPSSSFVTGACLEVSGGHIVA